MRQIDFYGDKLDVVDMEDGKPGIAARRLVENLGLSWGNQSEKLKDPHYRCSVIRTPSQGGAQETIVIPLNRINAYLYSINHNKVREDLQEKIRLYQDECADVLYNYWAKGYAVNPRTSTDDNMRSFFQKSGGLAVDFLQNMLDQTAETPVHNELMGKVIGHILKESLRAEDIDLSANVITVEGRPRFLSRTEMIVISVLELEIGAWIHRNKALPQSEDEVMDMARDVGILAMNNITDARFTIRSYTERFDKPLSCFLEKL
ncbi:hypothetical protein CRX22_10655 [Salmonella enterica subsp. enterica serovar Newport]|nr:hypothetical protein [Salmonella enterica subsp. enterica serovar Newport]